MDWTVIVTGITTAATTLAAIWKLSSTLEKRFVNIENSLERIDVDLNRIENDIKEMKTDIKEIKHQVTHLSERVSHLEGGFEERGRNEIIKLVQKE
jgi:peptidoglycan hydrolase CwlO-like protein